jgi:hypothetical protein
LLFFGTGTGLHSGLDGLGSPFALPTGSQGRVASVIGFSLFLAVVNPIDDDTGIAPIGPISEKNGGGAMGLCLGVD